MGWQPTHRTAHAHDNHTKQRTNGVAIETRAGPDAHSSPTTLTSYAEPGREKFYEYPDVVELETEGAREWTDFDFRNYLMHFWQPGEPLGTSCSKLRRIGGLGDGGKQTCRPSQTLNQSGRCLVLSVGSNGDVGFEASLHALAPQCEVHIYDPTLDAQRRAQIPPFAKFFSEPFTAETAQRYRGRHVNLLCAHPPPADAHRSVPCAKRRASACFKRHVCSRAVTYGSLIHQRRCRTARSIARGASTRAYPRGRRTHASRRSSWRCMVEGAAIPQASGCVDGTASCRRSTFSSPSSLPSPTCSRSSTTRRAWSTASCAEHRACERAEPFTAGFCKFACSCTEPER